MTRQEAVARYHGKLIDYDDLNARDYPDKEALVDSRNRLTFSQVKLRADRLALGFIKLGLKKGQIVINQLPNVVEYYTVRSAVRKAGVGVLNLLMNYRQSEMKFALEKTSAVAVVIVAQSRGFNFFDMIQELRPNLPDLKYVFVVGEKAPEEAISITQMMERPLEKEYPPDYFEKTCIKAGDIAGFSMTSGTTGFPKLNQSIARGSERLERSSELARRFKITSDDIFSALAPLSGGGSGPPCKGLAESQGCKVVLLERFDAEEALKLIEQEKVTFATGVPAMLAMMVRHPNFDKYDLSSLRAFYYAGSTIPYGIAEEVEEKMGCRIVTLLGGLDLGFQCTTSIDDPTEVRRTSVGKLMNTRVQLRTVDEQGLELPRGEVGEVVHKEAGVVVRDLEVTRRTRDADGWIHSGDLGRFDEQGNLYIVGRKRDMIIRGGQNIYPVELESMLIVHPKVADVAVVAMPDLVMGEKACAYVIPKPGQTLTFDEMVPFLLEKKVAKYKLPERLEMVDSFPMSGDGQKVLKRELTERVTRNLKAQGAIP